MEISMKQQQRESGSLHNTRWLGATSSANETDQQVNSICGHTLQTTVTDMMQLNCLLFNSFVDFFTSPLTEQPCAFCVCFFVCVRGSVITQCHNSWFYTVCTPALSELLLLQVEKGKNISELLVWLWLKLCISWQTLLLLRLSELTGSRITHWWRERCLRCVSTEHLCTLCACSCVALPGWVGCSEFCFLWLGMCLPFHTPPQSCPALLWAPPHHMPVSSYSPDVNTLWVNLREALSHWGCHNYKLIINK